MPRICRRTVVARMTDSEIRQAARLAAKANGGTGAEPAWYVRTVRSRAHAIVAGLRTHSTRDGIDHPVIVIKLAGEFTTAMARVPKGRSQPSGRFIYLTLAEDRDDVSSFAIGDTDTDLSALGPVVDLQRPS
jgi:hypothetical protein